MIPILILWSTLLFPQPIQAPAPPSSPQEQEISSVIQQQLDAFTLNDYEAAYQLASKQVKEKFSQEGFTKMVHTNYPEITKSIRVLVDKINLDPDQDHAVARIRITGFNHKKITAEYQMVHERDGWKIDRMTIVPVRASMENREKRNASPL